MRGARIGMIFQEPMLSLNPVLTIGAQIVEVIERHTALRADEARAKARELLDSVGVPDAERRLTEFPFQLSGGLRQRVMIAMSLACEPELPHRRRADHRARCDDTGPGARAAARPAARAGACPCCSSPTTSVWWRIRASRGVMYAGQIVETAPCEDFFAAPASVFAQAVARLARRRPARPAAAGHCRHGAAALGRVPGLPFRTTLQPGPERMHECGARTVRCRCTAPGALFAARTRRRAQRCRGRTAGAAGAGAQADDRPAAPPLLQVQRLGVAFPIRQGLLHRARGAFHAVKDLSFAVARGRTLALVGESGCGKTTTGKAIVQLLRGQAQIEGRALLEGRNLFELQGEALLAARRDVQIIFQDPFASLNPRLRVFELLEEGLQALHPQVGPRVSRHRVPKWRCVQQPLVTEAPT
jgi:peptide/nickel transport system ATP-binding protein